MTIPRRERIGLDQRHLDCLCLLNQQSVHIRCVVYDISMFHHAKDESEDFLPNLTRSFKEIDVQKPIPTKDFVSACSKVQPIFDHIGTFSLCH